MKKLLGLVFVVSLCAPSLAFAAVPNSQVQTTLVQQLLAEFVSEVNSLQAMQDTIATAADPTQFQGLKNLLQSQFNDTESELVNVLQPNQTATLSTAPVALSVANSVASPTNSSDNTPMTDVTPQCVPNPQLTLTIPNPVVATSSPSFGYVADFTNGCPLVRSDATADAVVYSMSMLDSDGNVVMTPSGSPIMPDYSDFIPSNQNRYHLNDNPNMTLSGVDINISGIADIPGDRSGRIPGNYTLVLTVNGVTQSAPFTVQ